MSFAVPEIRARLENHSLVFLAFGEVHHASLVDPLNLDILFLQEPGKLLNLRLSGCRFVNVRLVYAALAGTYDLERRVHAIYILSTAFHHEESPVSRTATGTVFRELRALNGSLSNFRNMPPRP